MQAGVGLPVVSDAGHKGVAKGLNCGYSPRRKEMRGKKYPLNTVSHYTLLS